ncbi:hypothetical protein ACW5W8_07135, partial [Aeromonas aquatilis]
MSARRSLTRGIGELLRLLDPGLSDLVRTPHPEDRWDKTTLSKQEGKPSEAAAGKNEKGSTE